MESDDGIDRWRGAVDEKLSVLSKQYYGQDAKIDMLDTRMQSLALKVEMLATKLVIYSALGATLGSAFVSVAIGLIFKLIAK